MGAGAAAGRVSSGDSSGVSGAWSEAAPLPFTHLFSVRCNDCGKRFFGWPKMGWLAPRVRRYKLHWLTEHRPVLDTGDAQASPPASSAPNSEKDHGSGGGCG